jgi:hypothetical protein
MILALQVVGLFFGIWFGSVNIGSIIHGQSVSIVNFVIMSAAWTSFITATWLI